MLKFSFALLSGKEAMLGDSTTQSAARAVEVNNALKINNVIFHLGFSFWLVEVKGYF